MVQIRVIPPDLRISPWFLHLEPVSQVHWFLCLSTTITLAPPTVWNLDIWFQRVFLVVAEPQELVWLGRQSGFTALCLTWRRCRGYKSKLSLKLLECLSLLLRHFLLLLLLTVPHSGPLLASHGSQARRESPENVAQSHDRTDERSPPRLFSATTKRMMGYFPQRRLPMISLKNAGAGT